MQYPEPLSQLIDSLKLLPGVGQKTAERFAFHLLDANSESVEKLSSRLIDSRQNLCPCKSCGCYLVDDACTFCRAHNRDTTLLCVVAHVKDVYAIEATREFKGVYHVLGGVLSPLDGKGPESLRLSPLIERIKNNEIKELIIAFDSTLEGDATALFLKQTLENRSLSISRLAFGLPMGSALNYVDGGTLAQAFTGRRNL